MVAANELDGAVGDVFVGIFRADLAVVVDFQAVLRP
jgi:hypothetical protein